MKAAKVDIHRTIFVINERHIEMYAAEIIHELMRVYGEIGVYDAEEKL